MILTGLEKETLGTCSTVLQRLQVRNAFCRQATATSRGSEATRCGFLYALADMLRHHKLTLRAAGQSYVDGRFIIFRSSL